MHRGLLLPLLLLATRLDVVNTCTSIAVGRDASSTGYPIISHSDDSGPSAYDFRLIRVPRRKWPEGSKRPLHYFLPGYPRVVVKERSPEYAPVNGQKETVPIGYIPQVPETFAYWDTDYGVQNEKGLSIGESTCTARTAGWPATPDKPYGYNRAGIEDLSKIAMERCSTARCAVETMGEIAVKMGFYSADTGKPEAPAYSGSSECLNVGDASPGEVWVFNVLTGRNNASAIWAAQRIPPDHVAPIGNAFTIRKMKLNDPENFLYSPGITDLAIEKKWWNPDDEDSPDTFDFFGAYGYTPEGAVTPPNMKTVLEFYSGRRMWRVWDLLTPEGKHIDPNKGNLPHTKDPYPTSLRAPKGSITPQMVMDVHRDYYKGTPYDLTQGMAAGPHGSPNRYKGDAKVVGQWERAISMYRTSWSHIVEARPNGRGVMWFGYDAPHGTAYLPFFGGATSGAPPAWHSHEGHMSNFSTNTAWWAFQLLNQYSDLNFEVINAAVRKKAKAIETEGRANVQLWEAQVAGLSDEEALPILTRKSNEFAEAKLAEWWKFAGDIFATYGRYVVTHNESDVNGEVADGQAYPEWWLRSPDVGFATWKRTGPYHGVHCQPGSRASLLAEAGAGAPVSAASLLLWASSLAVASAIAHQVGVRAGKKEAFGGMDRYIATA